MKIKLYCATAVAAAAFLLTACDQKPAADTSAEEIQKVHKEASAVSNQLTEASMKLNHQEQMNRVLEMNATNLIAEIHQFSNQVVKLRAQFPVIQREAVAAQSEVHKRDVRIAELDARITELLAQISRLASQYSEAESRYPALQKQIAASQLDCAKATAEIERLKQERSELIRAWDDPVSLNKRLAELNPKSLKKTATNKKSGNARLQYKPDGSVVSTSQ